MKFILLAIISFASSALLALNLPGITDKPKSEILKDVTPEESTKELEKLTKIFATTGKCTESGHYVNELTKELGFNEAQLKSLKELARSKTPDMQKLKNIETEHKQTSRWVQNVITAYVAGCVKK